MNHITMLGIESSCDDTSEAVIRDGVMLSNVIASQAVHEAFGGVGSARYRRAARSGIHAGMRRIRAQRPQNHRPAPRLSGRIALSLIHI